MATSKLLSCCTKCHRFKNVSSSFQALPVKNVFFRGLVMADQRCASFRLPLCKTSSVLFCHKSDQLFRPSSFNSLEKCHQFATIAEIESKQFLKRRLTYFNLLIKIEGLDGVVLDNFSQFIISTSKMMNLSVTKKFNLTTEKFSQTLAFPPESYKKQSITYHLKKHGRMIEIGEVPVEKSDIYIQYLQENTPVGVSVKMELKKWQDYVSPPDPRYLEQKQLEYERMRERKKKRDQ
ncbi:PREDICTED: uncharacterized protein LOC107337690 isoform X1 [Acropora digitifera]|uniref:uncharacterized protein LOC107337690 isoform X1 n=2 Tax=Acropora digitifera TaxID=70779 RepID=UPI00077AFF41|nr:PREDICTED: uncharacterized protein LOC107337690 isoform X1 [Acropora digitifera]